MQTELTSSVAFQGRTEHGDEQQQKKAKERRVTKSNEGSVVANPGNESSKSNKKVADRKRKTDSYPATGRDEKKQPESMDVDQYTKEEEAMDVDKSRERASPKETITDNTKKPKKPNKPNKPPSPGNGLQDIVESMSKLFPEDLNKNIHELASKYQGQQPPMEVLIKDVLSVLKNGHLEQMLNPQK